MKRKIAPATGSPSGLAPAQLQATLSESGMDYGAQKQLLAASDLAARLQLAGAPDTRPEILYYLASDESDAVRQAVAANPATPVQADQMLSEDADEDVRADLALKIARLLPDMPHDEQEKVRELTFDTLKRLASDQLPRVRALLAEELKSSRHVPV
ncbi:MAG: hypothetical protein QGF20_13340, partial [Alphaproteobacteria bacterium]|nr:hypothetical protein [Alphaproteobacteria bacterium]